MATYHSGEEGVLVKVEKVGRSKEENVREGSLEDGRPVGRGKGLKAANGLGEGDRVLDQVLLVVEHRQEVVGEADDGNAKDGVLRKEQVHLLDHLQTVGLVGAQRESPTSMGSVGVSGGHQVLVMSLKTSTSSS